MGLSFAFVVHHATRAPIEPVGLSLFLCGVVATYGLDRLLDPPQAHARLVTRLLVMTTVVSGAGVVLLARRLPMPTVAVLPLFALAAVGYAPLKRIALMKGAIVPLVWTWAAIALPFHDGSWFGWRWIEVPVAAPLFLLVASGCLLCDLKDVERDRQADVPSLPVRWGVAVASLVAIGLAAAGSLVAAYEHRPTLELDGLCLIAVAACPVLVAQDVIGPLVVDVILTLPGVLIALHRW